MPRDRPLAVFLDLDGALKSPSATWVVQRCRELGVEVTVDRAARAHCAGSPPST